MALNHTVQGSTDYFVIGSPTIVDGVVSGFSNSNFLQGSQAPSGTQDIDIVVEFSLNQSISSQEAIFHFRNFYVLAVGDTILTLGVHTTDGWKFHSISFDNSIVNQNAFVHFHTTGTSQILEISTDGISYNHTQTFNYTDDYSTENELLYLGCRWGGDSPLTFGSINLKHTYIKVNGAAWFGNCPVELKHFNFGISIGYTKVGSPTISNGVASGFSVDDYVQMLTSLTFSGASDIEFDIEFTTPSSLTSATYPIIGCDSIWTVPLLYIESGSSLLFDGVGYAGYSNIQTDTTYRANIKIKDNSGTIILYGSDGTVIGQHTQSTSFAEKTVTLLLGAPYGNNSNVVKNININKTSIKVNGKLWFFRPCINYRVHNGKLTFADSGLYLSGPVNYTVVGSPTIVDGVMSGFSDSNYSTISTPLDLSKAWEIVINYDYGTVTPSAMGVLLGGRGHYFQWQILTNGQISYAMNDKDGNTNYGFVEGLTTKENSFFKMMYDPTNKEITCYKGTNGLTWTQEGQAKIIDLTGCSCTFDIGSGVNSYGAGFPIVGSVNFNNTHITQDSSLWFYGKNYASQNIAPVPGGYPLGNTTTPSIGWVDMRTQQFTAAPAGATLGKDE